MTLGAVAVFDVASAMAGAAPNAVSTVSDPAADTIANAPAFRDLVRGQMTRAANGDFELLMEMAAAVPLAPILPPHSRHSEIWWVWALDLDASTAPTGYPVAFSESLPEFLVYVSWDGAAFAGTAIDRRPLLAGQDVIITPVEFSISGTIIDAVLPFALIGDVPQSFRWSPNALDWAGPVGSAGYVTVDSNSGTVSNP